MPEFLDKWKEDFKNTFGEVSEVVDLAPRKFGSHYFAGFQVSSFRFLASFAPLVNPFTLMKFPQLSRLIEYFVHRSWS